MSVMGSLGSDVLCVACIRYTLGCAQTYMYLAKCCMQTLHTWSHTVIKTCFPAAALAFP